MPDQNTPQDPLAATPKTPQPPASASAHVDISKVLLPKKEAGPSVDSAQRINAGVLFEQEQKAGTEGVPNSGDAAAPAQESSSSSPSSSEPKKEESSMVRPLQTYQGDIESLVGEKNISVVSIAAAEADRRAGESKLAGKNGLVEAEPTRGPFFRRVLMVLLGLLLLAAAGGAGYYIYLKSLPVPIKQQASAPFLLVDDTQTVGIMQSDTRAAIMQALKAAHDKIALSLGLIARIQVVKPTAVADGSLQEVGAPELLQLLAPAMPPTLLRTLEPQMLLGVHSYDQNQSFMILKADSYETAYSGMLSWEAGMQADLSPLFTRTPAVRNRPDTLPAATSSTTSTSSGQATSTTPSAPAAFFQGNFIDKIVENRDARVILSQEGDILLLWTFLDRNTIVVTTNEATLREVISRLSQAAVLSLPAGQ